MNEQYLQELTSLLDYFRPVVRDACPTYPAMVSFNMTTQYGDTDFLIGCNTESGNFAVDMFLESGEQTRVIEFLNSENISPEDLIEQFGDWLDTLNARVDI